MKEFSVKKISDFIIDKRYIIGLICLVIFYLIFGFDWKFKLIILTLITFEFLQIITNKNKYFSLIGAILISFSSAVFWHKGMILDIVIIFGELGLIAVEYFMKANKVRLKILWSLVFTFSLIAYIYSLYTSWGISFGYIFLALLIWIIIKNIKDYKFNKIEFLYLFSIALIVVLFVIRFYEILSMTYWNGQNFNRR